MAEIPVESLIREVATERGVDPNLAVKIAQRESSLYPRAKNPRSSAYGLFQITNDTWKEYGGTPENRYDMMENIRIGMDIIASNRDTFLKKFGRAPSSGELYTMHMFGKTGGPRLLSQDPNALMTDVVSPQIIKANKISKTQTVGEFIASMQKKMGSRVDTMMARRGTTEQKAGTVPTPQAPKETIKEKPVREPIIPLAEGEMRKRPLPGERLSPIAQGEMSQDMIASLGPNYQAALGAVALADTRDEEDDDEESFAERYAARREEENRFIEEQQQASRPSALASLDLSYQSPFEEEEQQTQMPVMMANGGMAETLPPELQPTFGQRMGAAASDLITKGLINAYDVAATDRSKMSAAHKIYLDTFGTKENRGPITKDYFSPEEMSAIADLIARKGGGPKGAITYEDYIELNKTRPIQKYPGGVFTGRMDPYHSVNKALGQFGYEYDPKTKQYKILDEYDFNFAVRTPEGQRLPDDFAGDYIADDLTDVYSIARKYGGRKMPPGTGRKVDLAVPAKAPVKRADGSPVYGEVADTGPITADTRRALSLPQGLSSAELMKLFKNVGKEGVSNLESLARGSVAAVPGFVGDIESLFRSDKERRFATTPEVERQYLPSRLTKPTKESAGFIEAGTFIDPTVGLKVAKPVAQGTAKAALAGFKSVSPQLETTLSKMAPVAAPMHVVKPTGGTTFPPEMESKIDDYLQRIERGVTNNTGETRPRILEGNELKGKDAKKIIDFVKSKGRNYLTKRYGSPQDEMKEAILDGRVTLMGDDAELFPPRLLAEAREGNPVALERYEEIYDRATGLRGIVVADDFNRATGARGIALTEDLKPPKEAIAKQKEWEKLLKEGALPHEINLNIVGVPRKDLGYGYGSDAETELRKFLSGEKVPPKEASAVMYAAKHGEPIYDLDSMYPRLQYLEPDTVIPALASVVDDLDRMSFPEALIRGMKKTEVLRNDEAAIARAAQGKSVPVELFQRGIEPITSLGDFSLVRVKSPFAVRMEGAAMRHSIGNYATDAEYGIGGKKAFESGDTQVFSIRNAQGKPIVSMDAEMIEGRPSFDQIRAVFNSEPNAQEKEAIFKAFDTFFPNVEQGKLDIFLPAVRYKDTREGHKLPLNEQTRIDWWQEYTNYLRKKDAN